MAISSQTVANLLQLLYKDYEESKTKQTARYEEGRGLLESVADLFGPGYLKGEEKKQLAAMEQGMVGRGLGGTTRPAAVGMGIKADIRDRQTQARAGALTNVANFMAAFQENAPDPGTLAHLATGGFSGALSERQTAMQEAQQRASAPRVSYGAGSFDSGGGGISPMSTSGGISPISGGGIAGSIPRGTGATYTGSGATTYGIGANAVDAVGGTGNLISDVEWADIQAQSAAMGGPGRQIAPQTTPGAMEEFQKTYTPQTGDVSQVSAGPGSGGYAPRTSRESLAATRAGYYGKQGQQLKPYTHADAQRLGFA